MIRLAIICFLMPIIASERCTFGIEEFKELKKLNVNADKLMEEAIRGQKKNAAIVLGNEGSGKSALINYLIGNELEAYTSGENQSIRIRLANGNFTGPDINGGSQIKSTIPTRWNSVRPEFQDLDIWDITGFSDKKDVMQDLNNSFHMYHLTRKVENLKFILVVSFKDIATDDHGQILKFLQTIDIYFNNTFIDDFKSISFIISKAPRVDVSGKQVNDEYISKKLSEYLLNTNMTMSDDSRKFLQNVIDNKQRIAFFRKVQTPGNVTSDIDDNIIPAISNSESLSKASHQDIGFLLSIPSKDCLLNAINDLLSLDKVFKLNTYVDEWFQDKSNDLEQINDSNILHDNMEKLKKDLSLIDSSQNTPDLLVQIRSLNIIPGIFKDFDGEENFVNKIDQINFIEYYFTTSRKIVRIKFLIKSMTRYLYNRLSQLIRLYSKKLENKGVKENN